MKTRLVIVALFVCFFWGGLLLLATQGDAQPPQEKLPGPWANAKVGDYLEAEGLYEDMLGDKAVDVEYTVTGTNEQTVTVKTVRKVKGDAPKEFSNKLPRYVSKADWDKLLAQYGEKIKTRKFSLHGKEVNAEEYSKKITDPKERDTYSIITTVISKEVPSWVLRISRKIYIKGQLKKEKLMFDVKRFLRKGA